MIMWLQTFCQQMAKYIKIQNISQMSVLTNREWTFNQSARCLSVRWGDTLENYAPSPFEWNKLFLGAETPQDSIKSHTDGLMDSKLLSSHWNSLTIPQSCLNAWKTNNEKWKNKNTNMKKTKIKTKDKNKTKDENKKGKTKQKNVKWKTKIKKK